MSDGKEPLNADAVLADLAAFWADPHPDIMGRQPHRIAGGPADQQVPEGIQNPYWEIVRQMPVCGIDLQYSRIYRPDGHFFSPRDPLRQVVDRFALCETFSWSIPAPGDLPWLRDILAGRGVVEAGAGTGYWAWQMEQAGIDTVAYEPNEVSDNRFARREWATLLRDDHAAPKHHPDRALFLCWPSYSEPWAAQALACYAGDMLIYAGEPAGGCTADDEFFRLLDAEWNEVADSPAHVTYSGIHDYLTVCTRKG